MYIKAPMTASKEILAESRFCQCSMGNLALLTFHPFIQVAQIYNCSQLTLLRMAFIFYYCSLVL